MGKEKLAALGLGQQKLLEPDNNSLNNDEIKTQNLINDFVLHPYGHPATVDFLQTVIGDPRQPLDFVKPRQAQIVFRYYSTPCSLRDVGIELGGTPDQVRKIIKSVFEKLLENGSESLRNIYGTQPLAIGKPYHIDRLLNKLGIRDASHFLSFIKPGITLPALARDIGMPRYRLRNIIQKLARSGVHIIFERQSRYGEIINQLKYPTSQEEISNIFSGATSELYYALTRRKDHLVVPIRKVANKLRYHASLTADIARSLAKAGIPVGKATMNQSGNASCYFIHKNDLERARRVINNDHSLKRFRK